MVTQLTGRYDSVMHRPTITVNILRLPHSDGLPLPKYATAEAAGMDLHAAVGSPTPITRGGIVLIPTGFAVEIPVGFEGQVRPRSGLAAKQGVTLPNSPATIDADYRGEILVPLINLGTTDFLVERGARIAQLLVLPVPRVEWVEVTALSASARGEKGFGHTGT